MIMTTMARPVFEKSVDDVCSPLSSMPCAIIALFTSALVFVEPDDNDDNDDEW